MIRPTEPTTHRRTNPAPPANSRRAVWREGTLHGGNRNDRIWDNGGDGRLDGLTVDCGDWWFNLRPSNTEPLLRLNLEAAAPADCTRHLAEVQAAIDRSA